MKELIDAVKLDLSNLSEKGWENYYIDEDYNSIPIEYDAIAKDLCNKIVKENFQEYKSDSTHAFIKADKELVKSLGFDDITVCPYKGIENVTWLNSNYIYMPYEKKFLTIDIYDCQNLTYEEIYDYIIQELFNFKRDAGWVKDEIYEQEMEKMKEEV